MSRSRNTETGARRYIARAPTLALEATQMLRSAFALLQDRHGAAVVRARSSDGPAVLSLTTGDVSDIARDFPELVLEVDDVFERARSPILPRLRPLPALGVAPKRVTVTVRDDAGLPVVGALVVLLTELAPPTGAELITDSHGRAGFTLPTSTASIRRLVVDARALFWSVVEDDLPVASRTVQLERLVKTPGGRFDWGTERMEASRRGAHRGAGIRVAIVDTGIAASATKLPVVEGENFIDGEPASAWNDTEGHGTHCAGIVAGIAGHAARWGLADEVEVLAARVFSPTKPGNASDIADAIRWAVNKGCHVVNLSLAAGSNNGFIRQAVDLAYDNGVLCVAAAGNDGSQVAYPAAYPKVAAVSSFGVSTQYPAKSMHRLAEPRVGNGPYLASFSNRGQEIDFCAPGVAVASLLPADSLGAWDGTSVSCPHVSGAAALTLACHPDILTTTGRARVDLLLARMRAASVDLGLGALAQGAGMPSVAAIISTAPHP